MREYFGEVAIQSEFFTHGPCHDVVVASGHHDFDIILLEFFNSLTGFRTYLICKGNESGQFIVNHYKNNCFCIVYECIPGNIN